MSELQDSLKQAKEELKVLKLERRTRIGVDKVNYQRQRNINRANLVESRQASILEGKDVVIHFVGRGDILASLTTGKEFEANTGLGVVINRNFTRTSGFNIANYQLDVSINVASSVDTLMAIYDNRAIQNAKEFGSSILLPGNSRRAAQANFVGYFPAESKIRYSAFVSGFQIRTIGSSRNWEVRKWEEGDTVGSIIRAEAATLALRAGPFHEFLPESIRKNKDYSVRLGLDFSMRWLFGDLDDSKAFGPEIRRNIFDKNDKHFFGIEPYITIRLQNITAEVSLPYLDPFGTHIPGLTGAQFLTTIRFVGGFPLDVFHRASD